VTTEFVDAVRQDISLLVLLAGGTGSGKTESGMRLATGLSGGEPFAVIDTENGRALHKADDYRFKYAPLDEPFTPERCAQAIKDADAAGFPVILFDSGSAEYEGIGGVLDMQSEEFERMGSRDGARMASWIAPKERHKQFVHALTHTRAHVILCLRAQDKVEMVKVNGQTQVRAKESLIGTQGWIPIVERRLPFEATISLLLLQSNPGVPVPIKLERRHESLIFTDVPLDEATGERLASWAKGSDAVPSPTAPTAEVQVDGATKPAPAASDESPAPPLPSASVGAAQAGAGDPLKPTTRQKSQIGVYIASLRDLAGAVTTEQLWANLATARDENADEMIERLSGLDDSGDLHFGPLLASLTRQEASRLIDWFKKVEAKVGAAA
jgi:hypothetical protein